VIGSLTHIVTRVSGKRSAHERIGEVIAAAVRVFTADGYRAARMSDVARAAGLSEAAIYRYVDSKEGLFVLAIRHALLLEDMPAGAVFPLRPVSLAQMILQVRDFIAEEVPFGSLAAALRGAWHADPAVELETVIRELYTRQTETRKAADMIERSARELPALADLLTTGLRRPVLAALTEYLKTRADAGRLRATPDAGATARLVLETLTWFARHRHSDPDGAAIPDDLAEETAVDALVNALVPAKFLGGRQ
jgi:AcrR family transcriptional regulator